MTQKSRAISIQPLQSGALIAHMAPRLNRRQLREQEELLALDAAAQDQELDTAESDQDAPATNKTQAVGFAAVG